ncbi:DUF6318 family protein [Terrabacter sp. GCM10028922]|uniref:DUF6318 family protein n=1 Tax=Terrabacter sp. GCM10028922 TaxID=3273428 RepID=UPI0036D8B984
MTAAARPDRLRRRRTLLPYAAALAALLTVTACTGGDPGPTATTPPVSTTSTSTTASAPQSTTASPTTSVDPVLAKIPAAARENDEDGGAAYVRYYFKQLNVAFRSADSSAIEHLASPDCVTCVAFSDGVRQLKEKGRRYGADLVTVSNVSPLNFTDGNRQVLLDIDQQAVPILNASGARVDVTPTGRASFLASLTFRDDHWTISRLQKVKT